MTTDEIHRCVKKALDSTTKEGAISDIVTKPMNTMWDAAGNIASNMGGYGLTAAIAGPPALGFLGGYGLSRVTDIDDSDVDEIKKQELIEEHHRLADMLRKAKARRNGVPTVSR
jgi:hypothetical protein